MAERESFSRASLPTESLTGGKPTTRQTEPSARESIRIPNYELQQCIGSGAFGRVYRARRKSDNAVVAIKILQPHGALTDMMRTRFLREATVLCQLSHPRIVRFRELGIAEEQLYLVMDFVESIPWPDLCKTLTAPRRHRLAFGVIDHCLDALVYLHEKGLVHRDLKPNNLLFEKQETKLRVYLADFGLAKNYLQAGHSGVTSEDEVAGTLGYLAPELLDGVKFYRPESDQYAMAATCYALLSGRPPLAFHSSAGALAAIRRHDVTRIETLVPDLPETLAEWLHTALQTDPTQRFTTARVMREALRESMRAFR